MLTVLRLKMTPSFFGIVTKHKKDKDGRNTIRKEYMAFANHEATDYVMRNMPSGDIAKVKYFVPMFDGGIAGFTK